MCCELDDILRNKFQLKIIVFIIVIYGCSKVCAFKARNCSKNS